MGGTSVSVEAPTNKAYRPREMVWARLNLNKDDRLFCGRPSSISTKSNQKLDAHRLGDLYIDRREPVVTVGLKAVDDGEELLMQGAGDGAHRTVAY